MKKVLLIIAISISVVACNKTAEEVKTAYVDTSVLMKEYTEAKDLEAKYKAQSEEKGRQLDAEIKDSNKTLLIFKVKRKQTVRLGHNKKENY
jgi:outer membrane protein